MGMQSNKCRQYLLNKLNIYIYTNNLYCKRKQYDIMYALQKYKGQSQRFKLTESQIYIHKPTMSPILHILTYILYFRAFQGNMYSPSRCCVGSNIPKRQANQIMSKKEKKNEEKHTTELEKENKENIDRSTDRNKDMKELTHVKMQKNITNKWGCNQVMLFCNFF